MSRRRKVKNKAIQRKIELWKSSGGEKIGILENVFSKALTFARIYDLIIVVK